MTTLLFNKDQTHEGMQWEFFNSDNSPKDLTGASITFTVTNEDGVELFSGTGSIVGAATDGIVDYDFTTTDLSKAGRYTLELKITFGDGTEAIFKDMAIVIVD